MKPHEKSWEPQLILNGVPSSSFPDTYRTNPEETNPADNFVISRKSDGTPLSYYSDDHWDFSTYRMSKGNTKIYFNSHLKGGDHQQKMIENQHRKLMFSLIYFGRKSLSVGTIVSRHYAVRALAIECEDIGKTLIDINEEDGPLNSLIQKQTSKNLSLRALANLFSDLHQIPTEVTGIPHISGKMIALLKRSTIAPAMAKQHAVIPQRLYLSLINSLEDCLDDFNSVSKNLYELVLNAVDDIAYARAEITQYHRHGIYGDDLRPNFSSALAIHNLKEWAQTRKINSLQEVAKYLSYIQIASKLTIHAFTGMRDSEVAYLTTTCLQKVKLAERSVILVVGGTSKLSGQHTDVSWVGTKEVEKAVQCAKSVSRIIATGSKKDLNKESHTPLFLSPTLLPFVSKIKGEGKGNFAAPVAKTELSSHLNGFCEFFSIDLTITEGDVSELYLSDPFRPWHDEPSYMVGKFWPLTYHQLRRSLAVYAANSGLVTLPSLKRQLKHLTQEMTSYYSRNSAFTPSFNHRGHVSVEFSAQQDAATTLALMQKVFSKDVRLFGVGGKALELAKESDPQPVYLLDAGETRKKVKNGELAYRETLLGGCISTKPCSQGSFIAITSCIDCRSAIFDHRSLDKINKAIETLLLELSQSDPASFEYVAANKQLEDLYRLRSSMDT